MRGEQRRHAGQQPLGDRPDHGQVLAPGAFRTIGQALVGDVLLATVQRLEKQFGVLHQALALDLGGFFILFIQPLERTGRQRLLLDVLEQRTGVVAVGARQWRQDARGRPDRDPPLTDLFEQILGQGLDQTRTPAHPTDIAPDPPGDRLPGMARGELLDQRRLLDRLPSPIRPARQTPEQRLIDGTRPHVRPDQVSTQVLQRLQAPVAVDQHPALRIVRIGDDHHRRELTVLFDGRDQPSESSRIAQAQRREAWNQGMQVERQDVFHGPYAIGSGAHWPSSPLFAITTNRRLSSRNHLDFHRVRVHLRNPRQGNRNHSVGP